MLGTDLFPRKVLLHCLLRTIIGLVLLLQIYLLLCGLYAAMQLPCALVRCLAPALTAKSLMPAGGFQHTSHHHNLILTASF